MNSLLDHSGDRRLAETCPYVCKKQNTIAQHKPLTQHGSWYGAHCSSPTHSMSYKAEQKWLKKESNQGGRPKQRKTVGQQTTHLGLIPRT